MMKKVLSAAAIICFLLFAPLAWSQSTELMSPYPTSILDQLRSSEFSDCPVDEKIRVPNSILKYLRWNDTCVEPTMIVIHFTGEWSDTDETIHILNDRRLGCHLATRDNVLVQMLDMYKDKVERAGCAAGYNNFAIHNEISGTDFDMVISDSQHEFSAELKASTEKAVASTCWLMKQYKIPYTQIFGHHEITPGKPDPGPVYMNYFLKQVHNECL